MPSHFILIHTVSLLSYEDNSFFQLPYSNVSSVHEFMELFGQEIHVLWENLESIQQRSIYGLHCSLDRKPFEKS